MNARRTKVSFFGLGVGGLAFYVYEYLRQHPEVYVPEEDINFFSDTKVYAKGIDWYENNFSAKEKKKFGELSYNYLGCVSAVPLIVRTYPNAKLFAVIANPLLAIKVVYLEAKMNGDISQDMTLVMFIKQYPEILIRFCFGKYLTQYFSYYSHNDLMVFMADEFIFDPIKNLSVLYKHLEIDPNFIPLTLKHLIPEEEEDPKKRGWIVKRAIKFIFKSIKKHYTNLARRLSVPKVKPESFLLEAEKINLSPDLEKYLKDYYRSDVAILSNLLHRNFNEEWGM